jgi:hypothetical protein
MLTETADSIEAVMVADPPDVDQLLGVLGRIDELRAGLDRAERQLIGAAREQGASWRELAAALGLRSRQAAEQRWLRLCQRIVDEDPPARALRA